MLDVRQIRADPEGTKPALARRGEGPCGTSTSSWPLDARRRELLTRVEEARADRNAAAKAIAEAKQRGEDAAAAIAAPGGAEASSRRRDEAGAGARPTPPSDEVMLRIPNIPHPSAPAGAAEEDAEIVRMYGKPPEFGFEPRDHLDLAGPEGWADRPRARRAHVRARASPT